MEDMDRKAFKSDLYFHFSHYFYFQVFSEVTML